MIERLFNLKEALHLSILLERPLYDVNLTKNNSI